MNLCSAPVEAVPAGRKPALSLPEELVISVVLRCVLTSVSQLVVQQKLGSVFLSNINKHE